MLILGIETSCDETAAAIVRDGSAIVSEELATQTGVHSKFGGVVPELACRGHVEVIDRVVEHTLAKAGVTASAVDAVAVTSGPGLAGALLVGVSFAKGLAYALDRPLIGINHLEGHIVAPVLSGQSIAYPAVALIVSGGHTHLYVVEGFGRYRLVGHTIDDAAGEAFDKAAYCLGLGFPGGPAIDRLAGSGDPTRFRFPRPLTGRGGGSHVGSRGFDMSFSGLKTAFVQALRREGPGDAAYPDLAAGFQAAVVDVLVDKTIAAAKAAAVSDIVIGGGVAANSRLRAAIAARAAEHGFRLVMPTPRHCTDNAAMIAAAAFHRAPLEHGAAMALNADPSLAL
ncbi:MAG TPA: tRNA (adenosine(37)-N6)-threonylcarbamoyltransferase complex transferase subunit TsaD [Nitrospiria bacterium]|nr:tRNA (adenosine(37)-N6)-threonylcarbamoyltransferase complex transferase subunit TsaD [Nitrospiria bacterium]